MTFKYPIARRDTNIIDNYHGNLIEDPYRWLEDPESNETKNFINSQNSVTRPYLENPKFRNALRKFIIKLWDHPKYGLPHQIGNRYYQFRNTGLQNQDVLYVADNIESLKTNCSVFLDLNEFSSDGEVVLNKIEFSKSGKFLAYSSSIDGSDWNVINFIDAETKKLLKDELHYVKFSHLKWLNNDGLFYSAYMEPKYKSESKISIIKLENQKLYYHYIGTAQKNDVAVNSSENPSEMIHGYVSDCENYLICSLTFGFKGNKIFVADLQQNRKIEGKLNFKPIVMACQDNFHFIANNGIHFVFFTDYNSPNGSIISININKPESKNWKTLVHEHESDVLESYCAINKNNLVLVYSRDVKNFLAIHSLNTGQKIANISLGDGTITNILGRRVNTELFLKFTSLTDPGTIYIIDFKEKLLRTTVLQKTTIKSYNPEKFKCVQVFYNSKDGTKIPMFILYKKGLFRNGTRPCHLYGYGGFSINVNPHFSKAAVAYVSSFNGVYAIANIRGGKEYGSNWHQQGILKNKQNAFDDFQAAAKYLVDEMYTSYNKISIEGASNGGLLVASCINQAPELFGAAIVNGGVTDMLRYNKFTVGSHWETEYGSPDNPEYFKVLYSYSPLHNVRIPHGNVPYPATLLIAGEYDDRVVPLHSLKFIAELQHVLGNLPKQKNPLMIQIHGSTGHGETKSTSKVINDIVDMYCFIGKSLNLFFELCPCKP